MVYINRSCITMVNVLIYNYKIDMCTYFFVHCLKNISLTKIYLTTGFTTSINLIVCLGLRSLLNILGHIMTVPACSSGALTIVLPQRNTMPQIQNMPPHPVTVYRHGTDLSLCYPLTWNVILEYIATQFNVLGQTRPGNSFPNLSHTSERSTL